MRGIRFDDFHTGNDWGMVLTAKSIPRAEPKENYVEVEGRDGSLDYTEAFGDIKYKDRQLTFAFSLSNGTYLEREDLISEIVQTLHGKRCKVITDDDPAHYFIGRCKVENIMNGIAYGTLQISVIAEPWYYTINTTKITIPPDSYTNASFVLYNSGRRHCIPTVTVSGSVTIAYNTTSGTVTKSLSAGLYILSDLILKPGPTQIHITTDSSATWFEWQEAIL